MSISSVAEVNGIDFDVQMKGVLVEQDSRTSVMRNAEVTRETLVLHELDRLLMRDDMPFPLLFRWRSSVVAGSDIFKAVYPSRMDETSSSKPERLSSSDCGKSSRLGAIPYWTGWITSGTMGSESAGASSGSMTNGMPAAGSFGCNTEEPFDAIASGYSCQDDCGVEGTTRKNRWCITRCIPCVVRWFTCTVRMLSEFTGFGAQHGPHTRSLSSPDSVGVNWAKLSLSDNPWASQDQDLESFQRCSDS